jgi:phosphatidylglycerol:prolipoprotein diacylglycerol transferase
MYPYLINGNLLGHLVRVPTYGVLIALAFSTGYFLTLYFSTRLGEKPQHVERIFLLVLISATLGGRLFHVFFENFPYYRAHPAQVFALWVGGSGSTFYGALIPAMIAVYLYAWKNSLDFLNFADVAAPAVAMGVAIGRVGCFCAGCCWGKPTDSFLGVTFSDPNTFAGIKNVPVHPVQLYGATAAFLGFLYLRWRLEHRRYKGQLFVHALLLYSIIRFLNEMFRGDDYRGYVFYNTVSYSQLISLLLLPVIYVAWRRLHRIPAPEISHAPSPRVAHGRR